MTAAEIKRRYREKKRMAGVREVTVMLEPRFVELIKAQSDSSGLTERQILQLLLDAALNLTLSGQLRAQLAQLQGARPEEIEAAARWVLPDGTDPEGGAQLT